MSGLLTVSPEADYEAETPDFLSSARLGGGLSGRIEARIVPLLASVQGYVSAASSPHCETVEQQDLTPSLWVKEAGGLGCVEATEAVLRRPLSGRV